MGPGHRFHGWIVSGTARCEYAGRSGLAGALNSEENAPMAQEIRAHWEGVYGKRASTEVSWYEPYPRKSLELIHEAAVKPDAPIIDVGSGASFLVDTLLIEGFSDLTVLDVAAAALDQVRQRLAEHAHKVTLIQADVTTFEPERSYALWHDRAVFHFLVNPEDRARYIETLRKAVVPGGHVVMATFGPKGPERCSGLPVQRYDAVALAGMLGSEFRLLNACFEEHRTPAGAIQQFLYTRFHRA